MPPDALHHSFDRDDAADAAPSSPVIALTSGPSIYAVTPDFIASCDVAGDFLVDGLLVRKQITLLASIPKGGKSTLTTEIVRDLLHGGLCLDRKTHLHPDEDILWLVEEPRGVFIHRLVDEFGFLAEPFGTRLLVAYRREFRGVYNWSEYVTRVVEQLNVRQQHTGRGIGLVIVDTFGAWANLDGDDEQKSGPMLKAFDPIYHLAEATGAAVLVNHHSRKAGGTDGRAVRGSTAITGGVDTIVELERPSRSVSIPGLQGRPRHSVRSLRALGRLQETCWFEWIAYDPRATQYDVLTSDGADSGETPGDAMPEIHRKALAYLAQGGQDGALRADLVRELALSENQAKKLFPALEKDGLAQKTGSRKSQRWFITEAGREAAGAK